MCTFSTETLPVDLRSAWGGVCHPTLVFLVVFSVLRLQPRRWLLGFRPFLFGCGVGNVGTLVGPRFLLIELGKHSW